MGAPARLHGGLRGVVLKLRAAAAAVTLALPATAAAQIAPIAPIPPPSAFERELVEERVLVRRIVVEGVRELGQAQVRAVTTPYEGRMLGTGDLRELEQRLTRLYVESGFVTSGVLLARPPANGEVAFTAIEGTVAQVRFRSPPRYASAGWLTSLLVPRPREALRIDALQARMAAMRDAGQVERINAELVPLETRGASELVVTVEERRPWSFELRYDNHQSPAIGARRPSLWFTHANPSGWGDRFDAHVGRTDGLEDFHVAYSAALPRSAWRAGARYERSDSLAIDPPAFRALEIKGASDTRRVELARSFAGRAGQSLEASLALERRASESTLLGLPFSFVPGVIDGVTELDVVRAASEFTALGTDAVLFLRGQWSEGRSRRSVESVERAPDSRFRVFALQAQYARRVSASGAQALARVDAQYTPDTLFPIEKKALGGADSVRGYRENVWLRDRAVAATIEGRLAPWKHGERASATLLAFVDAAWGGDSTPRADAGPSTLASIGVGVAFTLPWGFSGRVDFARPTRRWLTERADSQDRGVHFRLSWSPR